MAQRLGLLNQMLFGDWAQRDAINRNADDLSTIESNVRDLHETVERQAKEILQLRAMFMGVAELLHAKGLFDEAELEASVKEAMTELAPPPPPPPQRGSDPYRGMSETGEASAEDVAAAKALLAKAQDHHFTKEFAEARTIYKQIVEQYGTTKQAAVARQQLANLR